MKSKENEYKELFLAEAQESQAELNRLLTELEKDPASKPAIDAIFRITHTLKGNALGMGFEKVAEMAHTLEDLFGLVRNGNMVLDAAIMASVFKGIDTLGELIESLNTEKEVRYKGIKTKLDVIIKKSVQVESPHETVVATDANELISEINELIKNSPPNLEVSDDNPEQEQEEDSSNNKITFSDLVQVPVRKLDNLLNLVGELIIEKDRIMASQNGSKNEYNRLSRIASDLQYSVMDVRMVQVGFLFNKFHRVVRDVAVLENKKVELKLIGTDTEIDRNVLQVISDSLIHLIRNSVGHGIETTEERLKAGKSESGTVTLSAYSEADGVIIQIEDDGKGIDLDRVRKKAVQQGLVHAEIAKQLSDQDAVMLIFEAGFSTMDQVTAISGRGVGMDVVKRALDSIGGNIQVDTTAGKGSIFKLKLPASMAVKSTLLFEMGDEKYALPLSYTDSVVSLYASEVHRVGDGLVATHLGRPISIVFLSDLFTAISDPSNTENKILQRGFKGLHPEQKLEIVVVVHNNRTVGLVVDKLLQQKEIVEKPLAKPVEGVNIISGVTILGNGNVCLVLNVATILNYVFTLTLKHKTSKSI